MRSLLDRLSGLGRLCGLSYGSRLCWWCRERLWLDNGGGLSRFFLLFFLLSSFLCFPYMHGVSDHGDDDDYRHGTYGSIQGTIILIIRAAVAITTASTITPTSIRTPTLPR
jgi:hypothetical protein